MVRSHVAGAKLPVRMTVDEFLDWNSGDELIWQLVDAQAMAPAKVSHAASQSELSGLVRNHLVAKGSPCSVLTTPGVIPRVRGRSNMRVPDLAVRCSEPQVEEAAVSDPVFIIEILSPGNEAETWSNAWTCTTIPSVQEILVLRSTMVGADLLRRHPDGSWPQEPETILEGDLVLESIGFQVSLADIYRTARLQRPPGG
jgi:Uma2 family endonuclease